MNALQQKMFSELAEKKIFDQALQHGAQYLDNVFSRNVYPEQTSLEDLTVFDEQLPENTTEASTVIELLNKYGAPATVAAIGGRYFGFVVGSVIPASMAVKAMTTFWDQNTAMQVLSPVAAKLETVVEKWLRSLFGLNEKVVAGFVSGSSIANLGGLTAARYRLLQNQNWDVNAKGLFNAPNIRIVAGRSAHSTVLKMISVLGLGHDNIEFIDTDDQGRIRTELIPALDNRTLLILQAGNVNSGCFDDFETICKKARQAGAWVHIDGAFGLWAAATNELKYLTRGMELASSWAVDGHKTLNTPYDCGIILCDDNEALTTALHMSGGYLVLSAEQRDGMFYTLEMSRRARVFELWAAIKYLGKVGIDQLVMEMHHRTCQFRDELSKVEGFSIMNDVVFNQLLVCCKSDELTDLVIKRIQDLRTCWVGGSTWQGRKVIRISVCSWATTEKDITLSVGSFAKALADVEALKI